MDICRDGVQEYMADEIYDPAVLKENGVSPDTILRVWRPPNVVFSDKAIAAHNGLALTREHPKEFVDNNNRPFLEKGINRGSYHNKDKATISGTGFVSDQLMVREIDSGEYGEISDGYDSELEFKPGMVPDAVGGYPCTDSGEQYDLIMTGYEPNHIAIVKEGRAGIARIHDKKNGGKPMAGFFEKLTNKSNSKKIKDTIKKVGRGATLRMLADEEPDEEKKAALEAMAEDAEAEDACDTEDELNASVNASNSETQDGDADQSEEEIATQARVVDGKPITDSAINTDTETTEVFNMDKKELAELISVTVNDAISKRLGDAGSDIVLDQEPTVVEEFEVDDGFGMDMGEPSVVDEFEVDDMEGGVTAEDIYELAKNSQDPAVAAMARALAQKLEGATAEEQAEGMESEEGSGFEANMAEEPAEDMQLDAPPATEEARLESAAEGDAPEGGTPSNQGTEAELQSGTTDGDKESDIVSEKDGYFIPKKLADSDAKVAVLMGNVLDTVTSYGLKDIDVSAHLKDGTIYHRLIDASGIGKITAPKGITEDRVNMAVNAIRANRQKVDGMGALINSKTTDSSSNEGFDPAKEL
jgi:hypothetical protein